ncbi:protein kinase domain-containing protein [Nonomuraea sp. bgisy101]|uniref:serine/threonine-protein kinase n=1 Tax=Nonomuraea sp. bgisy101 TaxID=3413784 RepID=UPI003D714384
MNQPLVEDDPQRLGPYDIVGRLGQGGQGVVYLGRTESGEQVAVKLLHPGLLTDTDARSRFLREVEIARRVARFSTAPVLNADLAGQRPYIVSEYVPGPSLHTLVTLEGPRRGAALDRLAISTATALAAIHRAGVLHRDFKPANILMGPEGPVVIDFGIARALDAPGTASTGSLMGTPSYLAPEHIAGAPATEAADIFAWGVTMVFAASGQPPFGADSTPAVIHRILHKKPEISGLDGMLLELVTASLSKDPAKRPSADGLAARLTTHHVRPARRGRRRTVILTVAGCAVAALAVAGGLLMNAGGHPVGSPAQGNSTFQPTVQPTTSPAAVPSQTKEAERLTTPPASRWTIPTQAMPKQTPRRRTSAPTTKQAHTESLANTPTGDESRKGSTPDPTSGTTPEPAPATTSAAPPTFGTPPTFGPPPPFWTPPENSFTCIPSMC